MKNGTQLRFQVLVKMGILAIVVLTASICDSTPNASSRQVAAERNEVKFDSANQQKAVEFLFYANDLSLEQQQMGQLAQRKSLNFDIQELGKTMADSYTQSLKELTIMANGKAVTLPITLSDKAQTAYNQLNTLPLLEFNRAYCDTITRRHEEAVAYFQTVFTTSTDDAIRQTALRMLPDLRTHLDYAMKSQKKAESMH
jgi:putative membrane protein